MALAESETRRPRGNTRWWILLGLFVARSGLGFQFQTLGSVSPELVNELSLSYFEVGALIGMFTMAGIVLSLPAGMALRIMSERTLVLSGFALLSIGGFIAAAASGVGLLGFARLICGVGFVVTTLYLAKMVVDWFAGKEVATALGILVMSWPLGIAIAQLVQPVISVNYGWQMAFVASGAYCLIGFVVVAVTYRPVPVKTDEAPAKTVNHLTREQLKLTIIASLVWALFNAGYVVYLSFAHIEMKSHGMTTVAAAAMASIPSWIMLGSSIVAGQIADRTGNRDMILYVGMAAATAGLLLLSIDGFSLPAVLLFGVLGAAPAGVIMALTVDAMPQESRAFGMGIFFTSYFAIMTPAPAIAGWLYDLTGDAFAPLAFGAALFAATALTNWLFRHIQRQEPT